MAKTVEFCRTPFRCEYRNTPATADSGGKLGQRVALPSWCVATDAGWRASARSPPCCADGVSGAVWTNLSTARVAGQEVRCTVGAGATDRVSAPGVRLGEFRDSESDSRRLGCAAYHGRGVPGGHIASGGARRLRCASRETRIRSRCVLGAGVDRTGGAPIVAGHLPNDTRLPETRYCGARVAMIRTDEQMLRAQQCVANLRQVLLAARKSHSVEDYAILARPVLLEVQQREQEILEYLSSTEQRLAS